MKPIVFTAAGNPENQDRGLVFHFGSRLVLTVADGAGGTGGGAEAAELAIRSIRTKASSADTPGRCSELLREIDSIVSRGRNAGETTCVLAIISGHEVFGSSVGDSGAWLIPPGGDYIDLSCHQIRKPLIGSGGQPVSFRHTMNEGVILLASDGLLKYAAAQRIVEVCRAVPFENLAERLVDSVRLPSGALQDDVTIVLANTPLEFL
jgi:serine/threonine protein phosphatase PrpC